VTWEVTGFLSRRGAAGREFSQRLIRQFGQCVLRLSKHLCPTPLRNKFMEQKSRERILIFWRKFGGFDKNLLKEFCHNYTSLPTTLLIKCAIIVNNLDKLLKPRLIPAPSPPSISFPPVPLLPSPQSVNYNGLRADLN